LIKYFKACCKEINSKQMKLLESETPIQGVVIPGNANVKAVAARLQQNDLDVRAILYPSVPRNRERLRIVLHSFNTTEQVDTLCNSLIN
jgi:8-amino-7-oxononanoate synthase